MPKPLSTQDQQLVAAFDRYAKYAGPSDLEIPGILFLKANIYRRAGQLEVAIPLFQSLIERYPRHEVAEYAANLLLDSYNLLERYDQLVALAEKLAKDAAFLSGKDDLAATVATILRISKRKGAEKLERTAKETKDWDAYVAGAKAYVDIYNADREARDNDEILYNAGIMFQEGRAIGEAIRMYGLLIKDYPKSRITARAMARLAKLYGDIAMYDKAADQLEEYAKRYPSEKDAPDAMSDAVFYRRAFGDRSKASASTRFFIKTFGAKRPREAADAMWSLTALYENDSEYTIKLLNDYLRTHGGKGGAERVVIAHARIGTLLWKQSCPHALVEGLCVRVKERAPRTCGTGSARTITATTRDATKSQGALAAFALAVKEYDRRGGQFDDPAARYYYAQAKISQADAELETYLADPAMRAASVEQRSAWLDAKRTTGAALSTKYDAVLTIKDAASSITAAARHGTLAQALASTLVTGALPRDVTTGPAEKRAAYCEEMTSAAAALEARATDAFAVCLAKSTEMSWFEASSASCEQRLVELKPDEFPRATERRSKPLFTAPVVVLEPPLR